MWNHKSSEEFSLSHESSDVSGITAIVRSSQNWEKLQTYIDLKEMEKLSVGLEMDFFLISKENPLLSPYKYS